jgi:hypothetical protein
MLNKSFNIFNIFVTIKSSYFKDKYSTNENHNYQRVKIVLQELQQEMYEYGMNHTCITVDHLRLQGFIIHVNIYIYVI